jgi:pyridoxamine 5'-phosphate oxidase
MGSPKSRVVLLKEVREDGFVFFTNYNSEKGQSIAKHNKVCLSFFWPSVERQIIIQGIAQKLSDKNSDQYFSSRPRGSQLGAHVSHQSREIDDRSSLEDRLAQLEIEYKDKPIPRPSHWGGFVVSPVFFEFWQGRPNRLHDRLVYHQTGVKWSINRLSP